jgi:SAM-dependent methyltransferase
VALHPSTETPAHFQALWQRHTGIAQASGCHQHRLAAQKFSLAERLYFTREALEQASSFPVARYRAARYSGFAGVLDLGCSAGGDALALAARLPVIGVDKDPLRLEMARANLSAAGLGGQAAWLQVASALPLDAAYGSMRLLRPRPPPGWAARLSVSAILPRCLPLWSQPTLFRGVSSPVRSVWRAMPQVELSLAGVEAVLWLVLRHAACAAVRRSRHRQAAHHLAAGCTAWRWNACGISRLPLSPQASCYEPDPIARWWRCWARPGRRPIGAVRPPRQLSRGSLRPLLAGAEWFPFS